MLCQQQIDFVMLLFLKYHLPSLGVIVVVETVADASDQKPDDLRKMPFY